MSTSRSARAGAALSLRCRRSQSSVTSRSRRHWWCVPAAHTLAQLVAERRAIGALIGIRRRKATRKSCRPRCRRCPSGVGALRRRIQKFEEQTAHSPCTLRNRSMLDLETGELRPVSDQTDGPCRVSRQDQIQQQTAPFFSAMTDSSRPHNKRPMSSPMKARDRRSHHRYVAVTAQPFQQFIRVAARRQRIEFHDARAHRPGDDVGQSGARNSGLRQAHR